jgi:hypothetical protein
MAESFEETARKYKELTGNEPDVYNCIFTSNSKIYYYRNGIRIKEAKVPYGIKQWANENPSKSCKFLVTSQKTPKRTSTKSTPKKSSKTPITPKKNSPRKKQSIPKYYSPYFTKKEAKRSQELEEERKKIERERFYAYKGKFSPSMFMKLSPKKN